MSTADLVLLHTSPVHVPVFDALRDADHPGLGMRHLVDEGLLARARAHGPAAVADAVAGTLAGAVADGARAVLCTCSTLGGVAERAAGRAGVPVIRVDRPMAAAAVAAGRRIAVVAAVESTLAPSVDLVRDEAERAGRPAEIRALLVEGAWARFEAGDAEGYLRAVARFVDGVRDADVVMLAQVSMASARALVTTSVPVLDGPRTGLAAAARAAGHVLRGADTSSG
ncbi:aspartate/glutamate racemase family protein [Streptomyces abyssomicinicus]|uniref:aspartate/glutamate racemase family protein n=1 Tax=Streptomyces abyssomicinicus TaxID=574929 RepID=UPI0012509414|nr:aspartate/glutamate racemase family protein [Streptomyces abyssomicinicus]